MADSSEKTEDPTGKRIQDARSKGQIARSRELSTTLVLVASSLMLLLFGSFIAEALFAISGRMFTLSLDETYDPTHMFSAWGVAITEVSTPVLSFMFVLLLFTNI